MLSRYCRCRDCNSCVRKTEIIAFPRPRHYVRGPPDHPERKSSSVLPDYSERSEFLFETGPLTNPYSADGRGFIALGNQARFEVTVDGAQVRFDEAIYSDDDDN